MSMASRVYITPGVPREMKVMFSRDVLPVLRDHWPTERPGDPG